MWVAALWCAWLFLVEAFAFFAGLPFQPVTFVTWVACAWYRGLEAAHGRAWLVCGGDGVALQRPRTAAFARFGCGTLTVWPTVVQRLWRNQRLAGTLGMKQV